VTSPVLLLTLAAALACMASCKPESARRTEQAARKVQEERAALERTTRRVTDDIEAERPRLVSDSVAVIAQATELAHAQSEFERRKAERIECVQAIYGVVATQPMVISTLARNLPITDASRGAVNKRLSTMQMRLDEAHNLIQGLHSAGADVWDKRDAQVREALERLERARQAAWNTLADAPSLDNAARSRRAETLDRDAT
jgi:hypothetical protein